MPYPNSAGYYGLQMPESVEAEITSLNLKQTAFVLRDLMFAFTTDDETYCFNTSVLSSTATFWIDDLTKRQQISLTRWLAERIDYLSIGTDSNANP